MASEPGAEILAWSRVNRQEGPLGSGCKHAAIDLGTPIRGACRHLTNGMHPY